MNYPFEKISELVEGEIIRPGDDTITNIITDSRRVYQSSNILFVALEGPNHDGHKFIPELVSKGVKSFIVNAKYSPEGISAEAGFIAVPDTLDAFQQLAAFHRSGFTGKVLAVTGSNGKTVVKEWLAQLLSKVLVVAKNPKSYNSQVGVPISVLMMEAGPAYHILEAGISMPGEMERLEEILKPDEGILTHFGDAHQENFPGLAEKLDEKLLLFKHSDIIFFCRDNPLVIDGIRKMYSHSGKKLVSWSAYGDADLVVSSTRLSGGGCLLSGSYNGEACSLEIPFSDTASNENLTIIWLFWLFHGYPQDLLREQVMELEPLAMRLEQKEGLRGCTLINDYYNADLHSLAIALDLLINQLPQSKKTLILSDLLQTGLGNRELVERINNLLEDKGLHRCIGIGPLFSRYKEDFTFPFDIFPDTESFLSDFPFAGLRDEAILLKGARKFEFEKISQRLEKHVHNTVVEIRMQNILHNLNFYRSKLSQDTGIMAMVKAFSYGSGSHEIAKYLAHQRIDYLGVAFADEGISLRQAGVATPIMVMNPDPDNLNSLIEHNLEPEIFSMKVLRVLLRKMESLGAYRYPVHIKLDTGLHRLGIQPEETALLADILSKQNCLDVKSVFSHLASSDSSRGDEFTHRQAKLFLEMAAIIRKGINKTFMMHLVNTAGIGRFPEYHFDMVRLGIGLYGIDPAGNGGLQPVIKLISHISQIHELKKGETIGYGRSETLKADGRIAVIPVGYADGLDRRLGNGIGNVQVNNRLAPIIGRICMDMCMVNITGIDASEGDEVTIFGDRIPLEEIAEKLNTIPYEILAGIPQRVKRVYLFE